jgi:hypothetical protein
MQRWVLQRVESTVVVTGGYGRQEISVVIEVDCCVGKGKQTKLPARAWLFDSSGFNGNFRFFGFGCHLWRSPVTPDAGTTRGERVKTPRD